MDKMDGLSLNLEKNNIDKIKELFPEAVEEGKINFDMLRAMLGDEVDDSKEKYQFTWNGKAKSIKLAQTPSSATLRPCKDEKNSKGEPKSKYWDTTENLYIEGNNLDVLKQLQKTYYGKIDVIYIDPPYNTGVNLIYKNDYSISADEYLKSTQQVDSIGNRFVSNPVTSGRFHSNWLNMIYPTLINAKNLLTDEGILVLTIDDNEISSIIMMLDELFGESNRLGIVTIKNNPQGRSSVTGFQISHEYALFYRKNNAKIGRLPRTQEQLARYKNKDDIGPYEWRNFRAQYSSESPRMVYPIYVKKDGSDFRIPNMEWNDTSKEYDVKDNNNTDEIVVLPKDESGRMRTWKWSIDTVNKVKETEMGVRKDRTGIPTVYYKGRMKDDGMTPYTIWDKPEYSSSTFGANIVAELLGPGVFSYPKSLYAVIDSLKAANVKKDSIVLDFFSGSATTAHAVMKMNNEDGGRRKFILVQAPELCKSDTKAYENGFNNICEIGEERIRRAGEQIKAEWEKEHPSDGLFGSDEKFTTDIGFKVFKLDSTNVNEWDSNMKLDEKELALRLGEVFKEGRSKEDILYEIMLKYGVFDKQVEEINVNGKTMYRVGKRYMIVCLNDHITSEDVKAIGELSPRTVIFNEAGFNNDNDKINAVYNLEKAGVEDVKCI